MLITSRRGSNATNIKDEYKGSYSYRLSKSAVNSALVALAMNLKKIGITVLVLHPGRVKTKMTKYQGMPPNESAALIQNTISLASFTDTGKFIDVQNFQVLPEEISDHAPLQIDFTTVDGKAMTEIRKEL